MAWNGDIQDGHPIDPETNLVCEEWHICDGTNGTPDLRGRFILGADVSHEKGSTGGEEMHTLTVKEIPEHSHTVTINTKGFPDGQNDTSDNDRYWRSSATYGNNTAPSTDNTGGGNPHNNMPPYYVLVFIMKTK